MQKARPCSKYIFITSRSLVFAKHSSTLEEEENEYYNGWRKRTKEIKTVHRFFSPQTHAELYGIIARIFTSCLTFGVIKSLISRYVYAFCMKRVRCIIVKNGENIREYHMYAYFLHFRLYSKLF